MATPATMRQVHVESIDAISVREVPVPLPEPGEVLVRSSVVGICGSDLHAVLGKHPFIDLPYQPGHEIVGVVEQGAPGVRPGERVIVEPNLACGKCPQCATGRYNICRELRVFGCQTSGGMADWFAITADRVHKLPDSLRDMDAALVEPLATAVHAVRRAGELTGRRVIVLGAGPVGLLVLAAARQAGAATIAISDPLHNKRQRALQLGADTALTADATDFAARAGQALGGPADVVFDCVAVDASIDQAVDVVDKGGTIVVVGVPAGAVAVRLDLVQDRELTITGTLMYVRDDISTAIDLVSSGAVSARDIVTATYPLAQAAQAFHAAYEPNNLKVLVTIAADE